MKPRHKKRDLIPVLSLEEIRRLLNTAQAIGPREHAMVAIGYHFGLRAGEYGLLRLEHVHLREREVYIPAEKGSHACTQPIRAEIVDLVPILSRWLKVHPGGPWLFPARAGKLGVSRFDIYYLFLGLWKKAGLPDRAAYPHILKASIGTHLLDAKAPVTGVQNWLRHISIRSTYAYLKYSEAAKRQTEDAMKALGKELRK